ncbi:MAG: hypothetical protein RLZZ450_4037, partial [Pseudomonadota bacterium]
MTPRLPPNSHVSVFSRSACRPVLQVSVRLALAASCLALPAACDRASTHDADAGAVPEPGQPVQAEQVIDAGGAEATLDASSLDAWLAPGPAVESSDAGPKRSYGQGGSVCDRPGQDAVRDVFCSGTPPVITGLRQLQERLEINFLPATLNKAQGDALSPSTVLDSVAFMGLSTALSGQLVSPINPRMILIGGGTLMAFQRGVQHVELASFDRA